MKKLLLSILSLYSLSAFSQDKTLLDQIKFNQIQEINYELSSRTNKPIYQDTAFNYFLKQSENAIPFLIDKITDTNLTTIRRKTSGGFYKKGDLAIILLSNIEFIPYYSITGIQFDICCETGYLPVGFLSYVNEDRSRFQSKYINYYYGQERKKALKRNSKKLKN
ncbi:MAG: hypothetical protein EOO07_09050 [Chitinophagaceae bacterium]|nr:MAG: hypothetical protein EOO07_09050 [Chitinophagaceae bacterium]